MAQRETFSDASTPPLPGGGATGLMRQYSQRFKSLFDASGLPLTAVGGTANAVTATLDPPLDSGGLVDGMKFTLTWAAQNTAGVTLALNGAAAVPVLDRFGNALATAAVVAGLRSLIEYIGGSFRILTDIADGTSAQRYWAITASTTWNKPTGLEDDQIILVEVWGGGAGGGNASGGAGGGGAGYNVRRIRAADMPSSVSITIGAGGAAGANGGNTQFGALLTAYGGGPGSGGGGGGGGGGETGAGSAGGSGSANPGSGSGAGASIGGGDGGNGITNVGSTGQAGGHAKSVYGGGGGGGSGGSSGGRGGDAVHGGAGGGAQSAAGGVSVHGGAGGAGGVAGSAPGGGGGRQAAGARGEVRITIL